MSHPEDAEQDGGKAVWLVRDQVSVLPQDPMKHQRQENFPLGPCSCCDFSNSHLLESCLCHEYHPCHSLCHAFRAGSAVFPSHTYFCSFSGTPHPGHSLYVLPHLTSHTPHQHHAAGLYFCLSPSSYYPASASPTYPTLSASMFQALSVICSLSPSLLLPPSSLSFKLPKAHAPGGKTVF